MRKNVNFSDRILIEKVVSENVDKKSGFFDSIRRVIFCPRLKKGNIFRQHKKRSEIMTSRKSFFPLTSVESTSVQWVSLRYPQNMHAGKVSRCA